MNNRVVWKSISSDADWKEFEALTWGFHDGVLKELRWSHGEYVDRRYQMVYEDSPWVWMLIQLQNEATPAIELRFQGVTECSVSSTRELFAEVNFERDTIVFGLSEGGPDRIVAQSCDYRTLDASWLGIGPFPLVEERETGDTCGFA